MNLNIYKINNPTIKTTNSKYTTSKVDKEKKRIKKTFQIIKLKKKKIYKKAEQRRMNTKET